MRISAKLVDRGTGKNTLNEDGKLIPGVKATVTRKLDGKSLNATLMYTKDGWQLLDMYSDLDKEERKSFLAEWDTLWKPLLVSEVSKKDKSNVRLNDDNQMGNLIEKCQRFKYREPFLTKDKLEKEVFSREPYVKRERAERDIFRDIVNDLVQKRLGKRPAGRPLNSEVVIQRPTFKINQSEIMARSPDKKQPKPSTDKVVEKFKKKIEADLLRSFEESLITPLVVSILCEDRNVEPKSKAVQNYRDKVRSCLDKHLSALKSELQSEVKRNASRSSNKDNLKEHEKRLLDLVNDTEGDVVIKVEK